MRASVAIVQWEPFPLPPSAVAPVPRKRGRIARVVGPPCSPRLRHSPSGRIIMYGAGQVRPLGGGPLVHDTRADDHGRAVELARGTDACRAKGTDGPVLSMDEEASAGRIPIDAQGIACRRGTPRCRGLVIIIPRGEKGPSSAAARVRVGMTRTPAVSFNRVCKITVLLGESWVPTRCSTDVGSSTSV